MQLSVTSRLCACIYSGTHLDSKHNVERVVPALSLHEKLPLRTSSLIDEVTCLARQI